MKRHLNTLYVTTQGAYVAKQGDTAVVRVDGETRLRVPLLTLDGIVCFGNVGVSPFLMGMCAKRDVTISFLTERGRYLAQVVGPVSGNVLLRREQYRRADDPVSSASIAQALVGAKVANCRAVILRSLRDQPAQYDADPRRAAADQLAAILGEIGRSGDLDGLRGLEGNAARLYFGVFDQLIVQQKEDFGFTGRNRRPPLDPLNSLLSFLYALLRHDVASALETAGLDPAVGYLHRDRPGRPGLALDIMEELRAPVADRLALTLVNRRQVTATGFTRTESGAVVIGDETRKRILVAYQERKQDVLTHPFLREKMPHGLVPHIQALLFARFLRGDLDAYPAFITR